uniref:Uncharacterized protein n=1 Tax=viral metagenome TaxID=1070528 RepID=A0A6M3KAB9_9ZZZZ
MTEDHKCWYGTVPDLNGTVRVCYAPIHIQGIDNFQFNFCPWCGRNLFGDNKEYKDD